MKLSQPIIIIGSTIKIEITCMCLAWDMVQMADLRFYALYKLFTLFLNYLRKKNRINLWCVSHTRVRSWKRVGRFDLMHWPTKASCNYWNQWDPYIYTYIYIGRGYWEPPLVPHPTIRCMWSGASPLHAQGQTSPLTGFTPTLAICFHLHAHKFRKWIDMHENKKSNLNDLFPP
jgi:hypothetical protein